MEKPMTVKEIDHMSDWLLSKGHTPAEVIECIKYIATQTNKKGSPKPAKAKGT